MINNTYSCTKLCVWSLAVAFGVTKGLCMMFLAWSDWQWGVGDSMVTMIASVYHGYAATLVGGIFGFGWGFLDGFIFGLIAACIYNICLCCCCYKKSNPDRLP